MCLPWTALNKEWNALDIDGLPEVVHYFFLFALNTIDLLVFALEFFYFHYTWFLFNSVRFPLNFSQGSEIFISGDNEFLVCCEEYLGLGMHSPKIWTSIM